MKLFACVLLADHFIRCWGGSAGSGSLGDGGNDPQPLPVLVNLPNVTGLALSATSYSACALTEDGSAWCWGSNYNGEVGAGTTGTIYAPVRVKGEAGGAANLVGVRSIAKGGRHTCALTTAGAVYCWGKGNSGQLGNGLDADQALPTQVKDPAGSGTLDGVTALALGDEHSCALLKSGTVACWGRGLSGELGSSGSTNHNLPVVIPLFDRATQISAGGNSTCVVKSDGSAWCWGDNSFAKLGSGTPQGGRTSTPVRFLP